MKKLILLAMLFSASCWAHESASKPTVFAGSEKISNQKFADLTIKGDAELNKIDAQNVTIHGHSQITALKAKKLSSFGPLSLSNSQLTDMDVKGPAEIAGSTLLGSVSISGPALTYSSKFKGLVRIDGAIECYGSAFEKILTIGGQESSFEEVAIKKIKVLKPRGNASGPQTIILKGADISFVEFESGNGIVKADRKSTIGKIVGGTLIRG